MNARQRAMPARVANTRMTWLGSEKPQRALTLAVGGLAFRDEYPHVWAAVLLSPATADASTRREATTIAPGDLEFYDKLRLKVPSQAPIDGNDQKTYAAGLASRSS